MSGPYFRDRYDLSDSFESADKDANNPVVNSDPFADKTPLDEVHIHETPMGGTVAAVGPYSGPAQKEIPMFETPIQEIPMGGTVAAAGPMFEPPIQETPIVETVTAVVPLNESTVQKVSPEERILPYMTSVGETINYQAPKEELVTQAAPVATNADLSTALLTLEESEHFRTRWNEIQGKFVDEPRLAVQEADALVAEVIEHITQMFAKEHVTLEGQWKQGNDVSTEDLRKALQQYRSFFKRLMV